MCKYNLLFLNCKKRFSLQRGLWLLQGPVSVLEVRYAYSSSFSAPFFVILPMEPPGWSVSQRKKLLYKRPRGGLFFRMGWRSTSEALLRSCCLGQTKQRTELNCVLPEREDGFRATAFEREVNSFQKDRDSGCFSFAGPEDWELEMVSWGLLEISEWFVFHLSKGREWLYYILKDLQIRKMSYRNEGNEP